MDTEDIELSDIEDIGSEDSDNKPPPPDRDFLYLDEIDREHAETIRSFLQNHPSEQDRLLSQFAKIYKKKIVPENRFPIHSQFFYFYATSKRKNGKS